MYEAVPRELISQGDIFSGLPRLYVLEDGSTPELNLLRSMMLSHDCEYEKRAAQVVHVAPVRRLADVDANMQALIRGDRVLSVLYLQAFPGVLEESYVDLRYITTIAKSLIIEAVEQGKREVSLDDASRLLLQRQIGVFFGVDRPTRP